MSENFNTKVKTGVVRFAYPKLFEAQGFKGAEDGPKKFSVGLIIKKDDAVTVNSLKAAFEDAKKEAVKKNKSNKIVQAFKFIKEQSGDSGFMTDCDTDATMCENPEYAGCYFLNASTDEKHAPGVRKIVDHALVKCEEEDIYGGCYGKVTGNLFAYTAGKSGISFGLANVLKVRDGEPFSSRKSAEADFADELGEDDDFNADDVEL